MFPKHIRTFALLPQCQTTNAMDVREEGARAIGTKSRRNGHGREREEL